MGVKGLWRILEPVKQHKSLADLRGQIIAVDLSIWIVEAKSVLPPSVTKPHLRNLFFRVLHLLQLGIVPVIVVEGVPPDLKQGVMRKRLKHHGRNGPPGELPRKIGRTRFQAVHRECCEMLEMLGVPFIQAASEAEAMCAFLNRHRKRNDSLLLPKYLDFADLKGYVTAEYDGKWWLACILRTFVETGEVEVSFLHPHGPAKSFRYPAVPDILIMNIKDILTAIVDGCITNDGDAFLYGARTVYRNFTMNAKDRHVDVYNMDDVESTLDLNRERLVGLAVLLGCDYLPKGVAGVGREIAMRFISGLNGESMLQRFDLWKTGGIGIGTGSASLAERSAEVNLCRRALASPGFPYKEVVDEFLVDKDKIPQQQRLTWKRPKMFKLVNYALARMEWPEEYTISKMLPLLTLFDMDALIRSGVHSSQSLRPFRVVKMRTRQGVSCFEVEWHKIDGDPMTTSEYYTTVEEQEMFRIAFPDLVDVFEDEKQPRAKERRQKPKKMPSPIESDEISQLTKRFQDLPMLQDQKGKEIKQQHRKNPPTCLPGKISSPHCLPKLMHRDVTEAFEEFDHVVKSSLRKSKSMASISEKSVCRRQKPPRFVISSDSSDDDCYWLDKAVDTCSPQENNKNALPRATVSETLNNGVATNTMQQKQELLKLDSHSEDDSDSSLECYLPLMQRLALQHQGVINHKSDSRKGTKNYSAFSENTISTSSDESDQGLRLSAPEKLVTSGRAEKLSCNDNRKISKHLNGLPSKWLDHSDSSEDLEKLNWLPEFDLRKSDKNEDSNSFKLRHLLASSKKESCHTQSQKFIENFSNLSNSPEDKIGHTDSVESHLCNAVSDFERNYGSSDQNEEKNERHNSDSEGQRRATAFTKLHGTTPLPSLPTACPWSVRQYGNFGIDTSILNDLESSYNVADQESSLHKRTALDDSQVDLFDDLSSCASPEWVDGSGKIPEEVGFVDVTSSPTMQFIDGRSNVKTLCCESDERRLSSVHTNSLATVSLADRLRLKFGNGTNVEILSHLAPATIQSSVTATNDL